MLYKKKREERKIKNPRLRKYSEPGWRAQLERDWAEVWGMRGTTGEARGRIEKNSVQQKRPGLGSWGLSRAQLWGHLEGVKSKEPMQRIIFTLQKEYSVTI